MDNNDSLPLLDMSRDQDHLNPFMVIIKAHTIISRFARLHPDRVAQLPLRIANAARRVFKINDHMFSSPEGYSIDLSIVNQARRASDGGQTAATQSLLTPAQQPATTHDVDVEEVTEDVASDRSGSSESDSEGEADPTSTDRLYSLFSAFNQGNARKRHLIGEAILNQTPPAGEIPVCFRCFT